MAVAGYFDDVQKIYIAFYQRPADPAGLRYWAERLEAANGDATAIIDAFATSAEATTLYGRINKDTVAETIGEIYEALFARAVEPDGLAFYVKAFMDGTLTAGNLALAILNAAREQDHTAIENKLTAANEFTQQVDGRELTDAAFGSGDDFAFDYAGEVGILAARAALAGVTSDPATVLDTEDVTKILKGSPLGGTGSGSEGLKITLKEAVELVKGTSFNDRINGTEKTLPGDTIEGGGGKEDRLKLVVSEAGISDISGATVSEVESVVIESDGDVGIVGFSEDSSENAFDISHWSDVRDIEVTARGQSSVLLMSAASNSVLVKASGGLAAVQDLTAESIHVEAGSYGVVMAGNEVRVDLELTKYLFADHYGEDELPLEQGGYGVVQAGNDADITITANEDNGNPLLRAYVQAGEDADIDVSGFYAAIVRAGAETYGQDGGEADSETDVNDSATEVNITAGGYAVVMVEGKSDIDLDFTDVTLPIVEDEQEQDFGGYAVVQADSIETLTISNAGLRLGMESNVPGDFSAQVEAVTIGTVTLKNVFDDVASLQGETSGFIDDGRPELISDDRVLFAKVRIGTEEDEDLHLILDNSKVSVDVSSENITTLNIAGNGDLDLSESEILNVEMVDSTDFEGNLVINLSDNETSVEIITGSGKAMIYATSDSDQITAGGASSIQAGHGADVVTLEGAEGSNTLFFADKLDSTQTAMDVVSGFQAGSDRFVFRSDFFQDLDFVELFSYKGLVPSLSDVNSQFNNDEINAVFDGTNQILYIDTNANGTLENTDFAIKLVGVTELSTANFQFDSQQG